MVRRICKLLSLCALLLPARVTPVTAGGDPPAYARAFELAFEPGWRVSIDDRSVGFGIFEAGLLRLTSGRIKACDPFVGMGHGAFTVGVPEGSFAVRLALVEGGIDDGRVAFARVDFSSKPVVRWEMAVVEGQNLATLTPGHTFGYPVDAGTGSFVDAETAVVAAERMRADEGMAQSWIQMGERKTPPMFHADIDIGPGNIIMFQSGWGDGVYTSWFGYDAQGTVAALVTDFLVIDWAKARW